MADDVVINIRERGSRQAAREVGGVATRLEGLGRRGRAAAGGLRLFSRATTSASGGLRLMAGAAVTGGAALGGILLIGAKKAVDVASDVNESTTKNIRLFGQYADTVDSFSRTSARSFGISRRAALDATGTFGNLFTALGIGPRRAAGMSVSLTKLAADLASFNNTSPEEALEAIRSGLVGETEPLRKYGVNIQDATLRQQALRMHLIKSTKDALDPQTKALAANALIFRQTRKAQGDFGRTSQGLANQQRILKANIDDLEGSLGTALLPTVNQAVRAINRDAIPAFRTFGKDLDRIRKSDATGDMKLLMTRQAIRRDLGPLAEEIRAQLRRAHLGDVVADAFDEAAPRIADAAGRNAGRAAKAFLGAWWDADIGGKLFLAGLVSWKLGVFRALGRRAIDQFIGGRGGGSGWLSRRLPTPPAPAGAGRLGRRFGTAFGIAAAAGLSIEIGRKLVDLSDQAGLLGGRRGRQNRADWIDRNIPGMKPLRKLGRDLGLEQDAAPRPRRRVDPGPARSRDRHGRVAAPRIPGAGDIVTHVHLNADGRELAHVVHRHATNAKANRRGG